jgi:hypothetical protein
MLQDISKIIKPCLSFLISQRRAMFLLKIKLCFCYISIFLVSCQSSALVVDLPQQLSIELLPNYIESDTQQVKVSFKDLSALTVKQNIQDVALLNWDFGPDVELESWRAINEFEIQIKLRRLKNAPYGEYKSKLVLQNNLGKFEGFGGFFVFP